jgi:hypothetical protein
VLRVLLAEDSQELIIHQMMLQPVRRQMIWNMRAVW